MARAPFLFGFAGWSGSGKTTLAEKIIQQAVLHHIRISTIKHAHHDFETDHEGKDSFRHRKAGAGQVLVASAKRTALITEKTQIEAPELSDLVGRLEACDWILVEGFKAEAFPKIEIYDSALSEVPLCASDKNIIAVVTKTAIETNGLPCFDRDDVAAIFAFLQSYAKKINPSVIGGA